MAGPENFSSSGGQTGCPVPSFSEVGPEPCLSCRVERLAHWLHVGLCPCEVLVLKLTPDEDSITAAVSCPSLAIDCGGNMAITALISPSTSLYTNGGPSASLCPSLSDFSLQVQSMACVSWWFDRSSLSGAGRGEAGG